MRRSLVENGFYFKSYFPHPRLIWSRFLTDSENIVRRSLVENGLARLCVFFGRQKANDVVLSHLITFLNDKNDWQLRAAFYSGIAGEMRIGIGGYKHCYVAF